MTCHWRLQRVQRQYSMTPKASRKRSTRQNRLWAAMHQTRMGGTLQDCNALVGWTSSGTACQAFAQKVSDSGDGTALLVRSGGDAGLRLRAEHDHSTWRLDDPAQWGEPFLLLADEADLRVAKETRWP